MSLGGPVGSRVACSGESHDGAARDQSGGRQRRGVLGVRDAEVDQLRAVLTEDDVARLEVAMGDPVLVEDCQGLGHAACQLPPLVLGQRAVVGDLIAQRRSAHVLDRQPRRLGLEVGGEELADVRVAHRAQDRDLPAEAVAGGRGVEQAGSDHLEGHTLVPGRGRVEDHAHAAGAEAGVDRPRTDLPRVVHRQRRPHRGLGHGAPPVCTGARRVMWTGANLVDRAARRPGPGASRGPVAARGAPVPGRRYTGCAAVHRVAFDHRPRGRIVRRTRGG